MRSLWRGSMKILSPSTSNQGGYPLYILMKNGVRYPRYGHHLVAEAFIGPRPAGQEVRHLDGNASSAALWDADGNQRLCYGTSGENKDDQVRHGTHYEASQTHCDNGHEFTEANTRIVYWPDGTFKRRVCRACANGASKEYRRNLARSGKHCASEESCDFPVWAKGLCAKHYRRQWLAAREAS